MNTSVVRPIETDRLLYSHLSIFVFGNVALLLIDQATPGEAWFYKVLIGWGLLVGLHAAYTYELLPWSTRDWEQRKVRELMDESQLEKLGEELEAVKSKRSKAV